MSEQEHLTRRAVRGMIRRRLLVNAVVDPDEAARRLPPGLRPHVTELGTVVGCCLLELDSIRPAHVPAVAGRRLRAVAHRISVEWDDRGDGVTVGVYVPMRQTDSRLAVALGGRWFPGVQERATVEIEASDDHLRWASDPRGPGGYRVRVEASLPSGTDPSSLACEAVAGTCLGADIGFSPDHRGALEGVRMEPDHRLAREVTIDGLDSAFLSTFDTARVAPSYLMTDVGVTWARVAVPTFTNAGITGRRL